MKSHFLMALVLLFFHFFSWSESVASHPEAFVICKLRSHVRTIAIHKDPEGFRTVYSKFGKPQTIGTGRSLESNRGFLDNVKANLEKSGWECREVKEASVVSSSEES